jgi:hypothetical protein
MAFMPWNYDMIKSMYPSAGAGFIYRVDNRINLHPPVVSAAIREMVKKEGSDANSKDVIEKAREITAGKRQSMKPYLSPTFGYISQWLSEVAGSADLDALLLHADTYLNPSWSDGGFYYSRCDVGWDANGNYTYVDPYTGNAAIGYARLNVQNGQKTMWDHPWTKEDVETRPWIGEAGFEQNVDCLRGKWDEEKRAMVATFRSWDGTRRGIRPVIHTLPLGTYGVYVNGELEKVAVVTAASPSATIELEVGEQETDLVVLRA